MSTDFQIDSGDLIPESGIIDYDDETCEFCGFGLDEDGVCEECQESDEDEDDDLD